MSLKRLLRQINDRQEGFALLIAIILLLVGSLLIAPALNYINAGLRHTTVHEKNLFEYYAAEAGFESAHWELATNDLLITEGSTHTIPTFILSEKAVDVTINNVGYSTHKVISTATSADGSTTTIESYLTRLNFFENAITSDGDLTVQPGSTVEGNAVYANTIDDRGIITGKTFNRTLPKWPTATELHNEYFDDIDVDDDGSADCEYLDSILDVKDYPSPGTVIGPLYRDGNLQIKNTGNEIISQLGGTIFITGDLEFKQPAQAYTIDLNEQTIFVEGAITFPPQKVNLTGSGCIIAVGDITFQPGIESNPDDFLFIFSVEGTVWFAPQDDFNGSVAGNVDVDLQPGTTLSHDLDPYSLGLNFPIDSYDVWVSETWNISQI